MEEAGHTGNIFFAGQIIDTLIQQGVQAFCVAPGGRNAPLVKLLDGVDGVYTWPEERSMAFFALGVSLKEQRPVAVITTSGTAVGELLPACMEAFHTEVPLIFITADRPKDLRGKHAPQTCDQTAIFGNFAPFQLDLSFGDPIVLDQWNKKYPCHLNVCFKEPL